MATEVYESKLYFEDLEIGASFTSGSYEMTHERIISFVSEFDSQPFHTDSQVFF